jgi:hypothetical protein
MIRSLDHLELLGPAHELSGLHGLPDGFNCDSRLPVIQGHINAGDMALLREDPGEDRLELGFIPLGDNPGRQIHMHFFRIARSTRPQFADAGLALRHEVRDGIAAKAGLTLEPVATNQRDHVCDLSFRQGEGQPIDGLSESSGTVISSSLASVR